MALLHEAVGFKKFDTRMVERNISRGVVSPQELTDIVKNLPDDEENAEWVSVETLAEEDLGEPVMNGKAGHPH